MPIDPTDPLGMDPDDVPLVEFRADGTMIHFPRESRRAINQDGTDVDNVALARSLVDVGGLVTRLQDFAKCSVLIEPQLFMHPHQVSAAKALLDFVVPKISSQPLPPAPPSTVTHNTVNIVNMSAEEAERRYMEAIGR